MKKALLILFGLICVSPILAEDWQPQPIGPFAGLNNRDNSFAIPASNAQDLLNVDFTPGGKSVKKRHGYGLAFSLPITGSPVHGTYSFSDSNGNKIALFFNSTYITASVNGSSGTVLASGQSNGPTYQCTDTLGFAYCANSNRDALYKTEGVTLVDVTGFTSTGTMVASTPSRLVTAGFSNAPSRIDFSADTDFNTWGTGSLATSAAQFTVNAPGSKITHITYAFGRLMWFKDSSFGYILIGNQPAQVDWVLRTVSYDVGTNDNSSVYREGILYFRGQDGHIYTYDGNTYQRLSREISGTINASQTRSANSWTQSSEADFESGSLTNLDSTTNPGSLQLSLTSQTTFQSYAPGFDSDTLIQNGTGRQFKATSAYILRSIVIPAISAGSPTLPTCGLYTDASNALGTLKQSGSGSYSSSKLQLTYTFTNDGTSLLTNGTTYWIYCTASGATNSNGYKWVQSAAFDTAFYEIFNGGSPQLQTNFEYYTLGSSYTTTGTYLSAVKNAPNLTTWDSFGATYQNNEGSHVFSIRAATGAFTVSSSTPAWTTISNGNVPSISTGSYFQIRDVFTTTYSTETPVLNDFTQNWFEGSATDKAYAIYFDDKILWSVASGVGATSNNRILVWDMLNQTWSLYDWAANGFYIYQNKLYFGSALGGYIYKYGDVENDNGSAINAYWKSKDFYGSSPFTTQEISNISVAAKSVISSSMTVTYTLNGSSSTSYTMPSYNANSSFITNNRNLPTGTLGSEYNVQVGNNAVDQPFEVFGIQVGIRPKSWKPTP